MDKKRRSTTTSMGKECVSFGCSNREYHSDGSRTSFSFFKFPTKNPSRNVWCNLVKRQHGRDGFKVTENTVICDQHFKESDIYRPPGGSRRRLKKGVLPSIFNWKEETITPKRKPPKERPATDFFRAKTRKLDCLDSEESTDSTVDHSEIIGPALLEVPVPKHQENDQSEDIELDINASAVEEVPCKMQDQSTQTDWDLPPVITSDHTYSFSFDPEAYSHQQEYINSLTERLEVKSEIINNLRAEIGKLQKELDEFKQRQFCIENYKDDDAGIRFYTGFPNYKCFHSFFTYLEPKIAKLQYWDGRDKADSQRYQEEGKKKPGRKRKVEPINEFFMVLVRLRVGLLVKDLSDRFFISVGQFSKIFCTWINFLYFELHDLFPFPSQQDIRQSMPLQFTLYPTTRVIIDCTEVFIEVPSSMHAQSQTWSNYKHHNTFKVLVGVSPNGQVTFVSKLWGGRVSDKVITLHSGILDLLEAGDNVMADRGFDIGDILPPGVGLNIPPFKGSRDQLTSKEVEETVHIASVRIHVERAIGRIQNFHILKVLFQLTWHIWVTRYFLSVHILLIFGLPFFSQRMSKY